MPSSLLILGAGYVGRELAARFPDVVCTRRRVEEPESRLLHFDLADSSTWSGLPVEGRRVVWTFPAAPPDAVGEFHRSVLARAASLIVLGSTSAYLVHQTDERVDENHPLDMSRPRVEGEEWLRGQGALILQLAGIFGPEREPARWLAKGKIRNGRKRVNLIALDDILDVIGYFLENPRPGERFNVSNGQSPTWNELLARFQGRGMLTDVGLPQHPPGPTSKRIDSRKLHALFPGKTWLEP